MKYAIIPKILIESEDVTKLRDAGIQVTEGIQTVNSYKIPCYKFYNLTETEVFDELEGHRLLESTESEKQSFANRMMSILFLRIRQDTAMKDKDQKLVAACSLCAAVNSLANVNITYAKRFLTLIRSII